MRILVIEDEKRLAATLADLMENAGYHTDIVHDGREGLSYAKSVVYDGIVLDVMLPAMDGFQILTHLRKEHIATPVLMLTAKSEIDDRIRGLDAGADYYLTKPFENREFLACLRAVLRRRNDAAFDTLIFGDLVLEPSNSQLSCGGRHVSLSAKELALLCALFHNHRQYLTKETLLLKIWGYDSNVSANCVEAYISFLRKKFLLLNSSVRISVIRNIGYKLEVLP